jgi:D-alanine-D-alanine ligase-like ATP-grasp enzyme
VAQACTQLLRRLDLQFGAIDLVLTEQNEYVFLEINPSGQFAWIEDLTKLPLMATLADLLVEKCGAGS